MTSLLHLARLCLLLLAVLLSAAPLQAADTVTYLHPDTHGSPAMATDASGNVVWRESYMPYGDRRLKQPASAPNGLWYTDKAADDETGLVYLGARWYDPGIGRFLAVDPAPFSESNIHSFNRYAYGNNSPYTFKDPDGHAPIILLAYFIPAATIVATNLARIGVQHVMTFALEKGAAAGIAVAELGASEAIGGATLYGGTVAAGNIASKTVNGSLWSATKSKSPVENALGHWNKHKTEFPELANAKQYVEATHKFATNPPAGTLTKVSGNRTLMYHEASNTFLSKGADGVPRNMFKPDPAMHGYPTNLDYFRAQ